MKGKKILKKTFLIFMDMQSKSNRKLEQKRNNTYKGSAIILVAFSFFFLPSPLKRFENFPRGTQTLN